MAFGTLWDVHPGSTLHADPRPEHVVVTGAAGFGRTAELVDRGHVVAAVDAFTGHYPPVDKWSNLSGLLARPGFELHRLDLATVDIGPLLAGRAPSSI